jgi:hypothetical protein
MCYSRLDLVSFDWVKARKIRSVEFSTYKLNLKSSFFSFKTTDVKQFEFGLYIIKYVKTVMRESLTFQ